MPSSRSTGIPGAPTAAMIKDRGATAPDTPGKIAKGEFVISSINQNFPVFFLCLLNILLSVNQYQEDKPMKKVLLLMAALAVLALALAACEGRTTITTTTPTEAPAQTTAEPTPTEQPGPADAAKDAGDAVGNAVDDAIDTPAENAADAQPGQ